MSQRRGWVADRFVADTREFATARDLARFLEVDTSTVLNIAKRIGISRRPKSIGATMTLYEPFTDSEAKAIIAEHRRSRGG